MTMGKKPHAPDLEALYHQAVELHQEGRLQQAAALYTQLIGHVPDVAGLHYNLGLALFESGRYHQAADAYRRAAELAPEDGDIFYNLGLACKKNNQYAEAEQAYLRALELQPGSADIIYNLGCCYMEAGRTDRAGEVLAGLLEEAPDYLPALNNLAYLRHLEGDREEARELYKRILNLDPQHASAAHMLAVLDGSLEEAPPPQYIRELFDHYSETYEENLLQDLEYNVYLDMRRMFDRTSWKKRVYAHALDLGCGTGLTGEAFRTSCTILTGVDLSSKMIDQAADKQIYDHLYADEIIHFLENSDSEYDLFLAADVLIYLGDLSPLFRAVAGRACQDALFCLSTEKSAAPGWNPGANARYAHHDDYVLETARQEGWTVLDLEEVIVRREGDARIRGSIFVLTRL